MNAKKRSFFYTALLVLPYVWSFFAQSKVNQMLRLYIVCPVILGAMLIYYISDRGVLSLKEVRSCFLTFVLFAVFMMAVGQINNNFIYSLKLVLILATPFSFSFLGQNIKSFTFVGYIYAAMSFLMSVDFAVGGITGGWNTNSIALSAINGVLYLFMITDIQENKYLVFNATMAVIMITVIWITGCRSVMFCVAAYLIIRYILFNREKMGERFYKIISTVLMFSPYLIMQVYFTLYESSYKDDLNNFFFDYTGKVLFTEREVVWQRALKQLTGIKYFIGTGQDHANAHNIAVDIMYSFGVIGLILFAIAFLKIIFIVYRYFDDRVIKSSVSCFFALLVSQSFESVSFAIATRIYNNLLYLFLAISLGRYIYLRRIEKQMLMERSRYR